MKYLVFLTKKFIFTTIAFLILFFFIFHSQYFKLDASSDTLILQNDKSFKFFNYYNEIFPSKNFLILACLESSIILKNPFTFDFIYFFGLIIEYLTPACAAK